jgi:hypothetical protein
MDRETKINYGLLLFGAAMPPVIDAIFGQQWALAALVVIACIGLILLISGHFHKERIDETESPLRRRGKFALYGVVVALACIGLRWAIQLTHRPSLPDSSVPPLTDHPPKAMAPSIPQDGPKQILETKPFSFTIETFTVQGESGLDTIFEFGYKSMHGATRSPVDMVIFLRLQNLQSVEALIDR